MGASAGKRRNNEVNKPRGELPAVDDLPTRVPILQREIEVIEAFLADVLNDVLALEKPSSSPATASTALLRSRSDQAD